MFRIVLYARAQAPGPSGLSSWNARVRGGSTALSGLTAIRLESATSQVRFAFALWWRAVNASCVSLRLDCTGWGSTGRVGLDRKNNVTPHSAGRARARRRDSRVECVDVSCGPGRRTQLARSGPVAGRCVLVLAADAEYRRVYHSIPRPRRRLAHSESSSKDERELPSSSPTRRPSSERPTLCPPKTLARSR